jgi:hypothetical protein
MVECTWLRSENITKVLQNCVKDNIIMNTKVMFTKKVKNQKGK